MPVNTARTMGDLRGAEPRKELIVQSVVKGLFTVVHSISPNT